MLKSSPEQLFKDYLVKTPPMGKGSMGEIREAKLISLNKLRLIKILYKNKLSDIEIYSMNLEF